MKVYLLNIKVTFNRGLEKIVFSRKSKTAKFSFKTETHEFFSRYSNTNVSVDQKHRMVDRYLTGFFSSGFGEKKNRIKNV